MGESACWLHLVCPACGRVEVDRTEDDDRCAQCRAAAPGDVPAVEVPDEGARQDTSPPTEPE